MPLRMRLGDKSIERDAARLRALLGPSAAPGGGGNDIFCQVMGGYNNTTGSPTYPGAVDSSRPTVRFTATENIIGRGIFGIDTVATITVTPIVLFTSGWGASRNVVLHANYQSYSGSTYGIGPNGSVANTTVAVPADIGSSRIWIITELAVSFAVSAGDVVFMHAQRIGNDGADNFPGSLDHIGWKIA